MRNCKVDILRFIGLSMIILAHVGPPGFIAQLRNFDVPLMVLVSGMAFGLTYTNKEMYTAYIWKRIKRLVFPVWIFLTFYFIALSIVNPESSDLTLKAIITSYTLISGIGFVWIIKVFLLVALVSPLLFYMHKRTQSDSKFFFIVSIYFLLYEVLRYLSLPYIQDGVGKMLALILLYIIPYALIFLIGLRMLNMSKKKLYILAFINLGAFVLIGFGLFFYNGKVISTQVLKYPPSIYYFSYAIFITSLLWIHSERIEQVLEKIKIKPLVLFIANNTIWIYLWHIPIVRVIDKHFIIKYIVVFTFSVAITYIQILVVNNLVLKRVRSKRTVNNIKTLFTG